MIRTNAFSSSFSLGLSAPSLRRLRRHQNQNHKNHHRTTTKMMMMTTERDAFEDAMKRFGIRSQIRLMTVGKKGADEDEDEKGAQRQQLMRGLFANANVGWTEPGVLLEVPLDVCIVAPIGDDDDDDDVIATNKTAFDIVKVFEKRNAYLPPFTKKLVQAKTSERREMGLALWLLWAIRAESKGNDVWREYGQNWLPKDAHELPSMLLAREEEELRVCASFDPQLIEDAMQVKKKIKEMFVKFEIQFKSEEEIGVRDGVNVEDLYYAFSLIRSRAIAVKVGETPESRVDNTDVAVLAPCVDMANHAASKDVNALKKIGASDGGGMKGSLFRLVNGGTVDGGGGSVVLETRRAVKKDEEITISYGPRLDNKELMRAYGFCLEANKFDRLEIGQQRSNEETWALNATKIRSMCEEMEIVYRGVDEKTLNYVDAIVRSVSLDESDFSDDDASTATTTTEKNVNNNAKELENAFKIHALWSVQLNAILETLSEKDLEDEMASLIETADERNRKKQNNGATAFFPAVLRYKQNHIRFLAKGCEVLQSYIDWLDDDEEEEEEEI